MTIYHYTGTWQTMTKSVVLYTKDKVKTSIPYKSSHLNGSLKRTHWKKNLLDVDETFEICAMKNILRAVSLQGFNEEIRYQNSRKGPTFVFVTVITFDQQNCKLYIKIRLGYFSSNSRLILCQNRKDQETLYFKLHVNLMSLDFIHFTAF